MYKLMKLLLCITLFSFAQLMINGLGDYCFGKDSQRPQTRHFSSKTAYQIIKGTNMDKQIIVPGCTAHKIWILHRHGTRLPPKNIIEKLPRLEQLRDEIIKNYRTRKTNPSEGTLCQEDLIAIQFWKLNSSITPDKENYLTSQGYVDLRGTAKLYQKLYSNIMPNEYNRSAYLFRHTNAQRTIESFKAFSEALFGVNNNADAEPVPEEDLLLRPHDYCDAWNALDYSGPDSEYYKYRNSDLWNLTIANISKRLGFNYPLDFSDVEIMYDMCRYEQAWHVDRTSVWCSAFLPAHVIIFEYEEDLKNYYKSGYGNELNKRVNCRLVQDMLIHMNVELPLPKAIVYFAHSVVLQTLITALSFFKDNYKLTALNYDELIDRRWMISNIDPFAGNFVAVKYQCDENSSDKEKVIFFLNQNVIDLDWCQMGLCNWSDVKARYEKFLTANCDEYYCKSNSSTLAMSWMIFILVSAVYAIF